MLQFHRLILTNFGPYKDTEVIEFPVGGVTIVYGENMRGKTTLLNGFRFALFGTVLTRSLRPLHYHDLVNWENAALGNHKASVELWFSGHGHSYRLTRILDAKPGIDNPIADTDYIQQCFLEQDGAMLNEAQTHHILAVLMPEEISRFFLFDGELLQQYEELLRQESKMGQEIADAIERILGVPVLKKARSILNLLVQEAQVAEGAAARRNKSTTKLGTEYGQANAECQALKEERQRYLTARVDLQKRQRAAEETIQRNQQGAALLDEARRLEGEVAQLRGKLLEQQNALKAEMAEAWKWILAPRVAEAVARMRKDLQRAREAQLDVVYGKKLLDLLQASLALNECQACGQGLAVSSQERIALEIQNLQSATSPNDPTIVPKLQRLLDALEPFQLADRLSVVSSLRSQIDSLLVQINDRDTRIREIKSEEMARVNQGEILDARQELNSVLMELGVVEEKLKVLAEQIDKKEVDIAAMQQKLAAAAGADERLAKERRRREVLQSLYELFEEGVKLYKHRLRERVERDASELFRSMTSESDYRGLQINDHYGLTIVHKDGSPIPVRSSGAEHVVALSLMGALQRNAPMRGPVVMDSPFGRLDDVHKKNIVRALPQLTDQVMLLVFEAELNPRLAHDLLPQHLKAEYALERISARHTQIRKS